MDLVLVMVHSGGRIIYIISPLFKLCIAVAQHAIHMHALAVFAVDVSG